MANNNLFSRPAFIKRLSIIGSTLFCGLVLAGMAMGQDGIEARLDLSPGSAIEPRSTHGARTVTSMTITAGTIAEPVTFDFSVRASAAAGSPEGMVELFWRTNLINELQLTPTNSTKPQYAYSMASVTYTNNPGDYVPLFFGSYSFKAVFVPSTNSVSTNYLMSTAGKSVTVKQPHYRTLTNGVKIFTTAQGSGTNLLQSGQTASVLYAGYLKNGTLFDDSDNHGGFPLTFTVGSTNTIAGFSEGALGMAVNETRIIEIPPKEGYGTTPPEGSGIPKNATLIFIITLESISD